MDAISRNHEVLLRIRGLSVRFGGVVALDNVSFDVERNHILGLIGPNGAGKTTLFNVLSRLYEAQAGTIELQGQSLLALPPCDIARVGVGRTFQNLALFERMSVTDNILAGAHCKSRGGFWADALRVPLARREAARLREQASKLIELLELKDVAARPVGALRYAVKKRVELARALA